VKRRGRARSVEATEEDKPKRGPGRPKGSKNRTTARRSAPAESAPRGRKAKRPTQTARSDNGDPGANKIGKLRYTGYNKADWNPRPDSGTGVLFALLKEFNDDVEAVAEEVLDDPELFDLIAPKRTRLGDTRTKDKRIETVYFRINRLRFDFGMKTGQHEKATNRSNSNGNGGSKPQKRRGRPPAQKAEDKPKRGRPKGSTNKPRATEGRTRRSTKAVGTRRTAQASKTARQSTRSRATAQKGAQSRTRASSRRRRTRR
jgi:hypothetical protein